MTDIDYNLTNSYMYPKYIDTYNRLIARHITGYCKKVGERLVKEKYISYMQTDYNLELCVDGVSEPLLHALTKFNYKLIKTHRDELAPKNIYSDDEFIKEFNK